MARYQRETRGSHVAVQDESDSDEGDSDSQPGSQPSHVTQHPVRPPISKYYSCTKVAQWSLSDDGNREITGYDAAKLITTRVFCVNTGTIFRHRVLIIETTLVMLSFAFACALTVTLHRLKALKLESIQRQSSAIQGYCVVLTTITTFLMGFFTSTNYGRWWRLRTQGVGALWSAGANLTMMLSSFVTQDEEVISAIDRYARASIMLIFMSQRGLKGEHELLVQRKILTDDEIEQLSPIREHNHTCCAIWTWVTCIIQGLSKKGLIKSDMVLRMLLEQAQHGRASAQLVMNQLACPLPMSYVALIGLMVKVHNYTYAVLYGSMATVGVVLHYQDTNLPLGKTTFAMEVFRVFILSMIFNSLLIVNQGMMNPFDGTIPETDFPMTRINAAAKENMSEYPMLTKRLPSWFEETGLCEGLRQRSLRQESPRS